MGFLGLFFKFALECLDILAWPIFALCYPLCASIQAIETSSISDTQKLITYWVCLSLILLLEHTFLKLIQWLPFWTYFKLIIVVCLVTPHFDGSLYVYQRFVHPCLSMDLHVVFNQFIKLKDYLKQDKDTKDTGAESLQNLVAPKPEFHFKESTVEQKNVNAVEIKEKKELTSSSGLVLAGNRTCTPPEKVIDAMVEGRDLLDAQQPSRNMLKERTCALFQVTTSCEANLISHLEGRQHEDACEKLRAMKSKISSASVVVSKDVDDNSHFLSTYKPWTCALCQVVATNKMDLASHFQGKRHEDALEKLKAKIQTSKGKTSSDLENKETVATTEVEGRDLPHTLQSSSKHIQNPWTCGICRVMIKTETRLILHLQGKRHKDACDKVKAMNKMPKSEVSPASTGINSNVNSCRETDANKLENQKAIFVEGLNGIWWCTICHRSCGSERKMDSHLNGSKHLAKTQENESKKQENLKNKFAEIRNGKWWCIICSISCSSDRNMNSHLNGSKHLARTQELSSVGNSGQV